MSLYSRLAILILVVVACSSSGSAAGDGDKARTDLYGDPLPPGAVARLGSVRFRFAQTISSLAFSPDGKRLVGSSSHQITVWDVATGKRVREFKLDSVIVRLVGFAPDGKVLALGTYDARSSTYDAQLVLLHPELGPESIRRLRSALHLHELVLSSDGKWLLALDYWSLSVWNLATRENVESIPLDMKASADQSFLGNLLNSSMALSPDHRTVAHKDQRTNAIHLMDLRTRKTLRKWGESAQQKDSSHLVFARDGERLIAAGKNGIFSWDATGTSAPRRLLGKAGSQSIFAVSPDGKTVATVDENQHVIVLWDTATGRRTTPEGNEPGSLSALTYTDSNRLASVAKDGVVRFWDTYNGKCLRRSKPDESFGRIVAVSPKGELLAGVTETQLVGIWGVAAGKLRWQSTTPIDNVSRLRFSPDGKTLLGDVVQRDTPRIDCWDAATGATTSASGLSRDFLSAHGIIVAVGNSLDPRNDAVRLFRMGLDNRWRPRPAPIHLEGARRHELSPDCRALLVFCEQPALGRGSMRLGLVETVSGNFAGWFNTANKKEEVSVQNAIFSPDSKIVAASYEDGSVRLWEVATRREIERFTADAGKAGRIAFSPDGRTIASERFDHTVLIWQARPLMDLDRLWSDLTGGDVEAAQRAIAKLEASPRLSVPYLEKRLPPVPRSDARRLRQLLADLDSDTYTVRQTAQRELAKEGEGAEDELREVLENKPSAELRRRVLELLDKLEEARRDFSPDDVRVIRAVQVLEAIGTAEARRVLKNLSEGAGGALRTQEARAALRRLEK